MVCRCRLDSWAERRSLSENAGRDCSATAVNMEELEVKNGDPSACGLLMNHTKEGIELILTAKTIGKASRIIDDIKDDVRTVTLRGLSTVADLTLASSILVGLPELRRLIFHHVVINRNNVECVSDTLKCLRIDDLSFISCRMLGNTIDVIATSLLSHSCLKSLTIRRVRIDDRYAFQLACVVACCSSLEELSICDTIIGNKTALALAIALKDCQDLRRLDVSSNTIGDVGALALAASVMSFPRLQSLNLASNPLHASTVGSILDATRSPTLSITVDHSLFGIKRAITGGWDDEVSSIKGG